MKKTFLNGAIEARLCDGGNMMTQPFIEIGTISAQCAPGRRLVVSIEIGDQKSPIVAMRQGEEWRISPPIAMPPGAHLSVEDVEDLLVPEEVGPGRGYKDAWIEGLRAENEALKVQVAKLKKAAAQDVQGGRDVPANTEPKVG